MLKWMLLASSLILAAASTTSIAAHPASAAHGAALYRGKAPLQGKIRGHDDQLPPEAIVCANCHNAKADTRLPGTPAPDLTRALLLEARPRRGGPPSSYNQASFCRLLRTGADPGYILIAREMPAYDLTDEQCASLWTFLLESKTQPSKTNPRNPK
jgi:cytochrome c553